MNESAGVVAIWGLHFVKEIVVISGFYIKFSSSKVDHPVADCIGATPPNQVGEPSRF